MLRQVMHIVTTRLRKLKITETSKVKEKILYKTKTTWEMSDV
jgi:hypothetical protein